MCICLHCGEMLREEAKFCPGCGKPACGQRSAQYSWQIEAPLISNPFILWNVGIGLLVALAIIFMIACGIFIASDGWTGLKQAMVVTAAMGGFFLVVAVITLTIVLGNRYQMEFAVDEEGVTVVRKSSRAHGVHRLALILGLLCRNPAAAGAGISGISGETSNLAWEDAKACILHPERNTIALKRKCMPAIYIFCNPDNYSQVSQYISGKIIM